MHEILDLQRDLHANDVTLCEQPTFGVSNAYISLSLFVSESRPSLNAMGLQAAFF